MKSSKLFQQTVNEIWKRLGAFDTARLSSHEGPCHRHLSEEEKLIVKLARMKIAIRNNTFIGPPRIKMTGSNDTYVCYDGQFVEESAGDRSIRNAYGKSPDVEFFIRNKDKVEHKDFLKEIFSNGLPGLPDEKAAFETRAEGRAPDKSNLSYGKRCDVILTAGNNRRTLVEVTSRHVLTEKEIKERIIQRVRNTDKMAFVAVSWTREAEESIAQTDGILLYTPTYGDKVGFLKIK
jgi:hypothetical protein